MIIIFFSHCISLTLKTLILIFYLPSHNAAAPIMALVPATTPDPVPVNALINLCNIKLTTSNSNCSIQCRSFGVHWWDFCGAPFHDHSRWCAIPKSNVHFLEYKGSTNSEHHLFSPSDEAMAEMIGCTTSHAAWTILESIYSHASIAFKGLCDRSSSATGSWEDLALLLQVSPTPAWL